MLKFRFKRSFFILMVFVMIVSAAQFTFLNDVYATAMDIWTSTAYENVFRDTAKPSEANSSIYWVAAKNEYESAQIVLRSDTAFTINSITFSDLTGGGNTISGSHLEYKFVGYQYLPANSSDVNNLVRSGAGYYPDDLLNDTSISVSANTTQPVWVTLYIPETAAAAAYTGTVTVSTSAGNYTAHIYLEVNNVQIPDADNAEFNFYFWQATAGWYNRPDSEDQIFIKYGYTRYSTEWWALMDKFAQSSKEHRNNYFMVPTVNLLYDGGTTVDSNGNYTFNWSRFDELIQFLIDRGCIKGLVGNQLAFRNDGWANGYKAFIIKYNNGNSEKANVTIGSADADNWFSQFLPALKAHLYSKGWLDIWLQSIADETSSQAEADQWITLCDTLNSYAPEIRVTEALITQTYASQYVDKIDVWTPLADVYENNMGFYNNRRTAGDDVWFYTCLSPKYNWLNRFIDQPVWMGRSLMWLSYQRNLSGFLHWGWNAWHYPLKDPYGDCFSIYPDPGNNDIKGSIRLEASRDGAEDFELLKILEGINPALAHEIASAIVTSGTSYSTDIRTMILNRNKLVRYAAGNTPPSPIPYSSMDFEDGDSAGWMSSGGNWSVVADGSGKIYRQTSASGEALSCVGEPAMANYSVEGKIKLFDLEEWDASGIIARYTDNNNYYMLRLANVGGITKVQLYKKLGGTFTLLDDEALNININQWYTLKLVLDGFSIRGYVDGTHLVSATDTSLSAGKIGVRSYNESIAVDDIVVCYVSLLNDNFEDGLASGWTAANGSWSIVTDGTKAYKQTGISGEAFSIAGDYTWTDYTIEAKIKLYDLDPGDASGILARYTDSNNYYMLRLGNLNGTTKVQLYKKAGGTFTLLDDEALTVTTGQWYTLKLILNGDSLAGYVDGAEKVSAADSSLSKGKIGARSYTESFSVDDVYVY